MAKRFSELLKTNDTNGLTFIKSNAVELSRLIESVWKTKINAKPRNMTVRNNLEDGAPSKKEMSPKQWKHLADTVLKERYHEYYKMFTDESKQRNGIGVTGSGMLRICERLSEEFQISSAEMVALLKAVTVMEGRTEK